MGDATFVNVFVGAVLSLILVIVFALEIAHRPLLRATRPLLPPADRPPTGLGRRTPVLPHEIRAEADRGYVALVSYLKRRNSAT